MKKNELKALTGNCNCIIKDEVRNYYDALRIYFKQRTRVNWDNEAMDTFFENLPQHPVGSYNWDTIFYYLDEVRDALANNTSIDHHEYDRLLPGHHYTTRTNRWYGDSAPVSFTLISKPREICRLYYGTTVIVEGCTMEIIIDGENRTRIAQIDGQRFRCNVTNTCVDDLFYVESPHFDETPISDEALASTTEAVTYIIETAVPSDSETGEAYHGNDAITYAREYVASAYLPCGERRFEINPTLDEFELYLPIYDYLTQNDTAETADNAPETVCPTIEFCEAICTDEKPQTPQEQFKDLCKRFKAGYSDTAELKPTEEYKSTATDDRGRAKEYMEICNRIGIEKRLMAKFEKEGNTEGVNGCKERILNLHRSEGYVKHHSDWQQENFRIERGQKNLQNIEFARRLFADYWKVEMDIDAIPLFVGDSTDFVNALTGQYFVNIMRDKPTDLIAVVINLVAQSKNGPLLTEDKLLHKFNRWLNYMSTSPSFNPNLDKWNTTDDILWEFIDKRRNFYENSEDRYPTNEEIFGLMTKEEN